MRRIVDEKGEIRIVNRKSRKLFLVANWKMNKTPSETVEYIRQFRSLISVHRRSKVVLCVPAVCVPSAVSAARTTRICIGAEDCHTEKAGAYTGEVSARMYRDAGCRYVVLEASVDNAVSVGGKLRAVFSAGLCPIICIRDENRSVMEPNWQMLSVLDLLLRDLSQEKVRSLVLAYETVNRETPNTPEQINTQCGLIRTFLKDCFSARDAGVIPILYACDPDPESAQAFLAEKHIDGLLVYQRGLEPQTFADLVTAAEEL